MNPNNIHQAKKKAIADTISKILDIEHAFRKGVKAQAGVEW